MNGECLITPSADPASPDTSAARPADGARPDAARVPDPTDRYMRMLDRLVELGLEQVELRAADARDEFAARSAIRAARVAAAVAAAEATVPDAATDATVEAEPTQELLPEPQPSDLAFQRMSRAIRLCMALALRLHNDRLDREAGLVKGHAAASKPLREKSLKEQLADRVKEKIEREAEPDEKAILLSELRERLEEDDIEGDLTQYPIEEVALQIARDLGAGPDGNFQGMGTLIIEHVIIDPPSPPDEPFREPLPPEIIRQEIPKPLHVIRAMNRRKPPDD